MLARMATGVALLIMVSHTNRGGKRLGNHERKRQLDSNTSAYKFRALPITSTIAQV
jgi:hypothetical protein